MAHKDSIRSLKNLISLVVILSAILISYSNTFYASWHFDDFDNIITNKPLHISDTTPSTLINTFFANPIHPNQKLFYRPLSNLSFALNWYWGGEDVWGYHLVNIFIHCIAAFFLFLSLLRLYDTPFFSDTDKQLACNISLLATLIWALNPIQTQAVTYIVQRMASMAAMFYIMAIYFYFRLRQTSSPVSRLLFFIFVLFCTLSAIGSKENAVTIPFSLILIEIIFFKRKRALSRLQKSIITLLVICITLASFFFILNGEPLAFLNGYGGRSFTFTERLLTEPRIVITYLTQLFYPAAFRLSLEHDIVLSKSLFIPLTTIPALVFIICLLAYAVVRYKKYPIISFSILFYLLNHLIESTIIPLELAFEHRNYLPSMFLFVPLADFLVRKISYYHETTPANSRLLTFFSITLLFVFATGTYIRNMSWISEETLWQDAINKAPGSARAAFNLGNVFLKDGRFDEALPLFIRAGRLSGTAPTPQNVQIWALNGIGSVYLRTDRPEQAVTFFEQTLTLDPSYNLSRFNLALALLSLHKWNEAKSQVLTLLNSDQNNADYLYLYNILELNLNFPNTTPKNHLKNLTNINPENANLHLLMAITYKQFGLYVESLKYFDKYNKIIFDNIISSLALLDIYSLQNNIHARNKLAEEIISQFTPSEIETALTNQSMMRMQIFSSEKMYEILSSFQNHHYQSH